MEGRKAIGGQVEESLLEIVGSTILKEIVGNIIGTKSAKLLFIWNTFNNWPADRRKTKAASFCNLQKIPFNCVQFCEIKKVDDFLPYIANIMIMSHAYHVNFLGSKLAQPKLYKESRACSSEGPSCLSS